MTLNQTKFKIATLISLMCLLIPVSIYGLWIYVFDLGTTQFERVTIFKTYFPEFLGGRWSTTILGILLCAIAIVLSGISFSKLLSKFWKSLNLVILIVAGLLFLLNIFSMM